ncbi:hypothetical protein [Natronococcus wangiae]|nr:hypothetical protein [Natronococcus sp. AD5]
MADTGNDNDDEESDGNLPEEGGRQDETDVEPSDDEDDENGSSE